MNSTIKPRSRARHLWWIIPLTAIIMVPTILAVSVVSCLRLSGEAKTLRNSIMETSNLECDKKIEVSVGGLLFTLARLGVSFFDVPPEVKAGIKTVRAARVGVYEVRNGRDEIRTSKLIESADRAMTARNWERIITVLDRKELVAIYMPTDASSSEYIDLSIVVLNERDMVIVSAQVNPAPLFEMAMRETRRTSNVSDPLGLLTVAGAH